MSVSASALRTDPLYAALESHFQAIEKSAGALLELKLSEPKEEKLDQGMLDVRNKCVAMRDYATGDNKLGDPKIYLMALARDFPENVGVTALGYFRSRAKNINDSTFKYSDAIFHPNVLKKLQRAPDAHQSFAAAVPISSAKGKERVVEGPVANADTDAPAKTLGKRARKSKSYVEASESDESPEEPPVKRARSKKATPGPSKAKTPAKMAPGGTPAPTSKAPETSANTILVKSAPTAHSSLPPPKPLSVTPGVTGEIRRPISKTSMEPPEEPMKIGTFWIKVTAIQTGQACKLCALKGWECRVCYTMPNAQKRRLRRDDRRRPYKRGTCENCHYLKMKCDWSDGRYCPSTKLGGFYDEAPPAPDEKEQRQKMGLPMSDDSSEEPEVVKVEQDNTIAGTPDLPGAIAGAHNLPAIPPINVEAPSPSPSTSGEQEVDDVGNGLAFASFWSSNAEVSDQINSENNEVRLLELESACSSLESSWVTQAVFDETVAKFEDRMTEFTSELAKMQVTDTYVPGPLDILLRKRMSETVTSAVLDQRLQQERLKTDQVLHEEGQKLQKTLKTLTEEKSKFAADLSELREAVERMEVDYQEEDSAIWNKIHDFAGTTQDKLDDNAKTVTGIQGVLKVHEATYATIQQAKYLSDTVMAMKKIQDSKLQMMNSQLTSQTVLVMQAWGLGLPGVIQNIVANATPGPIVPEPSQFAGLSHLPGPSQIFGQSDAHWGAPQWSATEHVPPSAPASHDVALEAPYAPDSLQPHSPQDPESTPQIHDHSVQEVPRDESILSDGPLPTAVDDGRRGESMEEDIECSVGAPKKQTADGLEESLHDGHSDIVGMYINYDHASQPADVPAS